MMVFSEGIVMDDKWLIVFVSSTVSALFTILTSRIVLFTNKKHELRERIFNSLKESIQQAESTLLEMTLLLSELMTNLEKAIQNQKRSYTLTERNDYFRLLNRYHKHLNEIVIWYNLYYEKRNFNLFSNRKTIIMVLNDLIEDMKHDYEYFNEILDKMDLILKSTYPKHDCEVGNELIQVILSFKVAELKTQYSQSLKTLMSMMYQGLKI